MVSSGSPGGGPGVHRSAIMLFWETNLSGGQKEESQGEGQRSRTLFKTFFFIIAHETSRSYFSDIYFICQGNNAPAFK